MKYLQVILQQYKSRHLAMINKNCKDFQYKMGDLKYIISPLTHQFENRYKKGNHKLCRTFSHL